MTSFFSGPIWIKFRRLVQNDISTAVIWPKSKPEFQYSGRIKWYVISEPRITLQGAATWLIHCHVPRATCHIAGCKNSIRHIENRFSPYFIFCLFFKCSLGFDERQLSYRLRYTCFSWPYRLPQSRSKIANFRPMYPTSNHLPPIFSSRKTRMIKLPYAKKVRYVKPFWYTTGARQTDRQTDIVISISRVCTAKNEYIFCWHFFHFSFSST